MAEARMALAASVAALTLCACAEDQQALMLDNLCRGQTPRFDINGNPITTCTLSGDAAFTTGMASNALAVRFGPAGGRLDIALAGIPAAHQSTWSFHALVASRRPEGSVLGRPDIDWGSCDISCPSAIPGVEVDVTEEVRWAVLVDNSPGVAAPLQQFQSSPIPTDAVITLRGSDLDLLDVSTPGFDENATPSPNF